MSKRRRTSSTSRQEDEGESSDAPLIETAKRRKKQDPVDQISQIYEIIRNHKKDDGTLLCDAFIRVPKRRQEPNYYEKVSSPIDMLKIQQKIKTDEYEDFEDFIADIELLCSNARAFYKKSSQEYKDANEFLNFFYITKSKIIDGDDRSSVESERKGKIILKVGKLARKAAAAAEARRNEPDIDENSESSCNLDDDSLLIEELFTAVMQATDNDKRQLNLPFMLLPSKRRYPKYYEVIENPIDLKTIARKIQANQYKSINELEKDFLLLTKNACTFNEPGSQIYRDAKVLKKIIQAKKFDIVHGKGSKMARSKRSRGNVQTLSAITAALKEEEEEEEESDEEQQQPLDDDSDIDDIDNPRWQLFETVKTQTSSGGHVLSEHFWRLPNRRYYRDYYKEIKNPVSLLQIKNKLKKGEYGTVSEVAGDLNIMFENAKKYNRPESRLFKDAAKLQKVMQHKVKELLDFDQQDQESESESDSDSPIIKRDSPIVKKRARRSAHFMRGKYKDNPVFRKRMLALCKSLTDFTYDDGRQPILMFMEKPSKKLYPAYYEVITEPIDLLQIQSNIRAEKYVTEEQLLADLRLMFENCRKFNEENSVIYKDANVLEEVMNDRLKELNEGISSPSKRGLQPKQYKPRKKTLQPLDPKLKSLYEAVKEFRDGKDRQLSAIFVKLPSKIDYPDYYEVIKQPIDLDKIGSKLRSNQYEQFDDLVNDLMLMLDNACKFNEPDSQIYKDALQLQRVVLQTKLQLREEENLVPDVQTAVQELLTSLFSSVYTHQDEEGRCFSDSMLELPEHDEIDGKKVRGISLDIVKRRLDKQMYKRLDTFQDEMFACFERARTLSRTDSQVFEDSVELQVYFVKQRDEICRGGDLLNSPALNYNLMHLSATVEQQKQQKLLKETPADEDSAENKTVEQTETSSSSTSTPTLAGESMMFNQQQYHVGDFVYVMPKERKNVEPAIIHILRGWTNSEGIQMLYGDCFYRPDETYHLTTRKFLEKEVFKSDQHIAVPLSQVLGRCCVMSVKDYFKYKPEGFEEKDVFVCESRYSSKGRSFKKIKAWPFSIDRLTLTQREEPFEPKRITSVFKDRLEKHITEIAELEESEKLQEREKPHIQLMNMPPNPDVSAYYQQIRVPFGVIKTGDFVYVSNENNLKLVAQVDTIWANKEGEFMFKGPWFLTPQELYYVPGRMFYRQELFQGCLEDIHPIDKIVGRCAVLEHSEYISCRPTEIKEKDVYICQSMYNEQRRQVNKLEKGLKRYSHSDTVTQDEIYFFRRLINPPKLSGEQIALAHLPDVHKSLIQPVNSVSMFDMNESNSMPAKNEQEMFNLMEDSMDGGPPSVGSGDIPTPSILSTPHVISSKKKCKDKNAVKLVTGYILYSAEIRRSIVNAHPEANFGEVSRIVGNEWRQQSAEVKQLWEEKAAKMNIEIKEAKALEDAMYPNGPPPPPVVIIPNPPNLPNSHVFECLWDNCDYQFDDLNDCYEHACAENSGHIQAHFAGTPSNECEYQCQWKTCMRVKKNVNPFPSLVRLIRHVKEVHIMKANGRVVFSQDRSKNYVPSKNPPPPRPQVISIPDDNAGSGADLGLYSAVPQMSMRPAEPLFVTVPPRTQRLLHSDAYIRYIEGLSSDNRSVSNWERHMRATQDNTPPVDERTLPSHWLGNGVGNHGNVVSALWTLRDFMLRDALNISKAL